MERDRRRVACRICACMLAAPLRGTEWPEKARYFSGSLLGASNCQRHLRALRLRIQTEQTRCSGGVVTPD
ncbi:hypothetical protein CQ052_19020 [Ochrobactrum sp. MYb15]|nr:hypothetical protein CQZ90_19950 [Ochrobactrum sp. MYb19]PRA60827.1 hypothetical protein CQ053_20730 [Ochrobactrum sp. MYb18]PRA74820.1 hypothetical protein CQ049_16585 [Brucella thiophenivorans]PRA86292.1 hypothetical protein CQ051_20395 [Ochrobactrum sp. MYb14]PRA97001.1 hypothetical protein CQ052_19020 [Ochrobactrum sp. MYb15]